jgi:putative two-component system response regulator
MVRRSDLKHSKILIVDDESFNILAVRRFLQQAGFDNFVTTTNSSTALSLVRQEKPDVVLLDILMPEVNGIDILRILKLDEQTTTIPVLIMTSASDSQTKAAALNLGATDFLPKPLDVNELIPRVRNVLISKHYQDRLAASKDELEEQVRIRTAELEASRAEMLHCLARAAEFRDDDTGQHVLRVGKYAGVIARALGFDKARVEMIELAAQLHDIGKIGVPDAVLHKPGKLDDAEFEMMQRHCATALNIIVPLSRDESQVYQAHANLGGSLLSVQSSPLLELAATIAQTHHERWDGTGYPLGLAGEDIPMPGRITAVADVYDALSSRRPYKKPFPREKCFTILKEGRGTHFDPKVLDAFFSRAEEIVRIQMQHMDRA